MNRYATNECNGRCAVHERCTVMRPTKNTRTTMSTKKEPKTKGQKMADKARQLTNPATDSERKRLLGVAMNLIYKGGNGAACVNRR